MLEFFREYTSLSFKAGGGRVAADVALFKTNAGTPPKNELKHRDLACQLLLCQVQICKNEVGLK